MEYVIFCESSSRGRFVPADFGVFLQLLLSRPVSAHRRSNEDCTIIKLHLKLHSKRKEEALLRGWAINKWTGLQRKNGGRPSRFAHTARQRALLFASWAKWWDQALPCLLSCPCNFECCVHPKLSRPLQHRQVASGQTRPNPNLTLTLHLTL